MLQGYRIVVAGAGGAAPIDRFDAIDHRSTDTTHKISVKERDRYSQLARELSLPVVPGVEVEVGPCHATSGLSEDVQVRSMVARGVEETR